MGLIITATGKDFSDLGLGNIHLVEKYITNAGITNSTQKAALRAFYTSFKAAGFYEKFDVFRLFFAGTALADSLNFIDPELGTAHYQATYVNDNPSYHTTSGWAPNGAAAHRGNSNYAVNGRDLTSFHMHVWNATAEGTDVASKYLLGCQDVANFWVMLARRYNTTNSGVDVGQVSPNTNLSLAGGVSDTGLLSASRQGSTLKMYKAGTLATSKTKTDTPAFPAAAVNMVEGTLSPTASAGSYTGATLRCLGYGESAWSDADESALKTMIDAFNTALA